MAATSNSLLERAQHATEHNNTVLLEWFKAATVRAATKTANLGKDLLTIQFKCKYNAPRGLIKSSYGTAEWNPTCEAYLAGYCKVQGINCCLSVEESNTLLVGLPSYAMVDSFNEAFTWPVKAFEVESPPTPSTTMLPGSILDAIIQGRNAKVAKILSNMEEQLITLIKKRSPLVPSRSGMVVIFGVEFSFSLKQELLDRFVRLTADHFTAAGLIITVVGNCDSNVVSVEIPPA